jgi:hypothetical protein
LKRLPIFPKMGARFENECAVSEVLALLISKFGLNFSND